jgi:hypothetical protein
MARMGKSLDFYRQKREKSGRLLRNSAKPASVFLRNLILFPLGNGAVKIDEITIFSVNHLSDLCIFLLSVIGDPLSANY